MSAPQFTTEQYEQAFREFHAGHIERQTRALETIRAVVGLWFLLTIAGALVSLALYFS